MSLAQEFSDWKKHPITQAAFEILKEREEAMLARIVNGNAGLDPLQDRWEAGYIAAVRDLTLISVEDVGSPE
jgi:hypothetical protein